VRVLMKELIAPWCMYTKVIKERCILWDRKNELLLNSRNYSRRTSKIVKEC